jgi:molybdate transport system substrate-binding protein
MGEPGKSGDLNGSRIRIALVVALAALASPALTVRAGEPLTVLCAGATSTMIEQIARDFERTHGRAVVVTEGTAGQLSAKLAAGVPADVVILPAPALDAVTKNGSILAGTRVDLGRTGMAVGVRAGAVAPDISTPDALRAALLAAPSIATTDPAAGASAGIYFAGLLQKMGIADAVRPKETLVSGGFSCDLVAAGKAALCVQNLSEIVPVRGVTVAGSFPPAVQNYITYAIAVATNSTTPDNARAFIADATSPARAPRWKSAGFEP